MRFSKLSPLLKQLSAENKKQLTLYLHSPYFKVPAPALCLYNYLQSIHQSHAAKHLTPAAIAAASPLLKTEAIQNKAATQLLQCIERFFVQQLFEQHPHQPHLLRLQVLKKQPLYNHYHSLLQATTRAFDPAQHPRLETYHALAQLAELHHSGFAAKTQRQDLSGMAQVMATQEQYHAIKTLRYLCEQIQRKQWANIAAEQQQAEPLLLTLAPLNTAQHPYVQLFLQVYHMLSSYSLHSPHYTAIKNYLLQHTAHHLTPLCSELLDYAIALTIHHINRGHTAAAADYLLWMELKEKHQSLLEQDHYLQPIVYRNLLTCGIYAGRQPTWLKKVTTRYYPHLPEEERESNYTFASGLVLYAEKDFWRAIQLFEQARQKNEPVFNHRAKRWCFMSHYLHGTDPASLQDYLHNWKKHLHTLDSRPAAAAQTRQFITYAHQLLHCHTRKHKKLMQAQLSTQPYFAGKEWIEETLKQ